MPMNMNRKSKTIAPIQPKRNKQTAESAEKAMLQDGKSKRLIADLQSNISKNCTLLSLLTPLYTR